VFVEVSNKNSKNTQSKKVRMQRSFLHKTQRPFYRKPLNILLGFVLLLVATAVFKSFISSSSNVVLTDSATTTTTTTPTTIPAVEVQSDVNTKSIEVPTDRIDPDFYQEVLR
jgi:hypothetical protein